MRARVLPLVAVLVLPLALGACGRGKRKKGASYDVVRVATHGSAACGVMKDGALRCWGDAPGATGRGVPEIVDPGPSITAACVGQGYACLVAGGAVRCMRAGGAFAPVTGVEGASDVSCERARACAIDASRKVSCWDMAAAEPPRAIAGVEGARALASNAGATCAVLEGGALSCFGDNRDGQLGDGTFDPHAGAVTAKIDRVERVAIGGRHACARREDETVWCWGRGARGQLGDGARADRALPAQVAGLFGADDVAAGGAHTCARMKDSTVRCWGDASRHQVGRSTSTEDVLAPALVPGLYEATAVAAGDAFSCARMKDGWLRCWGANDAGQLGEGSDIERAVPVPIRYP